MQYNGFIVLENVSQTITGDITVNGKAEAKVVSLFPALKAVA